MSNYLVCIAGIGGELQDDYSATYHMTDTKEEARDVMLNVVRNQINMIEPRMYKSMNEDNDGFEFKEFGVIDEYESVDDYTSCPQKSKQEVLDMITREFRGTIHLECCETFGYYESYPSGYFRAHIEDKEITIYCGSREETDDDPCPYRKPHKTRCNIVKLSDIKSSQNGYTVTSQ